VLYSLYQRNDLTFLIEKQVKRIKLVWKNFFAVFMIRNVYGEILESIRGYTVVRFAHICSFGAAEKGGTKQIDVS